MDDLVICSVLYPTYVVVYTLHMLLFQSFSPINNEHTEDLVINEDISKKEDNDQSLSAKCKRQMSKSLMSKSLRESLDIHRR